jgi:hypothetical protein
MEMQSAEIVDFANARIQRAAAVTAARAASDAAELAAMFAVGKLVETIAADKASGKLSAPEVYLARFNQEKRP